MVDASVHARPRPGAIARQSVRRTTGAGGQWPRRLVLPAKRGRHAVGASAAHELAPDEPAVRRWLGRGGMVGGSAVSLAIGAVLGGLLEGVPHLLGPSASGGSIPVTMGGQPNGAPTELAGGRAAPAGTDPVGANWNVFNPVAPLSIVAPPPGAASSPSSSDPAAPSPATGAPASGGAAAGGGPGTGAVQSGSAPPAAGPPACDASCAALQGVGQSVSQVPGVGGPLSGAVSQAAGSLSGATGAVGPALPAAPGPSTSTSSTAPSGVVSNVASTASGILSTAQGSLGL